MIIKTLPTTASLAIAALAYVMPQAPVYGQGPEPTDIKDIVLYGIDADTYELLRYDFRSDSYVRVAKVVDEGDNTVTDVEGLAYIFDGYNKGLYGAANYYLAQPTKLALINPLDGTATLINTPFQKIESMVALNGADASPVTSFAVASDVMVPSTAFAPKVTVLGCSLTRGGAYDMPISVELAIGAATVEPWGPFDQALTGNVNDGRNPRQWIDSTTYPAITTVTIRARAWDKINQGVSGNQESHWEEYKTVSPAESPEYLRVLRDGDPVPNIPGWLDQPSAAWYVRRFIDPETNTIHLQANQAIFLFELGAPNINHPSADFQDLVLLVSLGDDPSYFTGSGEWVFYAANKDGSDHTLVLIDPQTGAGTVLMSTSERYTGLALDPSGTLYGSTKDNMLWIIDLAAGTETPVGAPGYDTVEALEFAFGVETPAINCPGVDPSWTANGVLFGFDDTLDAFMILNPANGDAVEYDCAFKTVDCEGLVFFTQKSDPYGPLLATGAD